MRLQSLALAATLALTACGGGDENVVDGNLGNFVFEEVLDMTFDVDTVQFSDGSSATIGLAILYGGDQGFCNDLNDAIAGDQAAVNRINTLDQLIVVSGVAAGQNPNLTNATVDQNNTPFVVAIFDPSQAQNAPISDAGTITMDFQTGEGQLDVSFLGSAVSVKTAPLNVQCAGMVQLFFGGQ